MVKHHLFVELKGAYDSMNRGELYHALEKLGIPGKLIRLTKMTLKNTKCIVRIVQDLSKELETDAGVR